MCLACPISAQYSKVQKQSPPPAQLQYELFELGCECWDLAAPAVRWKLLLRADFQAEWGFTRACAEFDEEGACPAHTGFEELLTSVEREEQSYWKIHAWSGVLFVEVLWWSTHGRNARPNCLRKDTTGPHRLSKGFPSRVLGSEPPDELQPDLISRLSASFNTIKSQTPSSTSNKRRTRRPYNSSKSKHSNPIPLHTAACRVGSALTSHQQVNDWPQTNLL